MQRSIPLRVYCSGRCRTSPRTSELQALCVRRDRGARIILGERLSSRVDLYIVLTVFSTLASVVLMSLKALFAHVWAPVRFVLRSASICLALGRAIASLSSMDMPPHLMAILATKTLSSVGSASGEPMRRLARSDVYQHEDILN